MHSEEPCIILTVVSRITDTDPFVDELEDASCTSYPTIFMRHKVSGLVEGEEEETLEPETHSSTLDCAIVFLTPKMHIFFISLKKGGGGRGEGHTLL